MSGLETSLPLTTIWAFIIAGSVFAYVVMDGFDLGIGILFPWFDVGNERDQAMNAIAPVWDGNETWLVLGGGGLFAAFPLAYAVVLPALYPCVIAMLLGLVFRGVAFEYRWRDPGHRALWDIAFTAGSVVAAFSQGLILGALLDGIAVEARAYAGGWWDWLSPFSILTGISVIVGYALLGATFLIYKVEGNANVIAKRFAWRLFWGTGAAIAAVSAGTLFLSQRYFEKWFSMPGLVYTSIVPILVAVLCFLFIRAMRRGQELAPFLICLGLFLVTFAGLGVSMWPDIIPGAVSIMDAAAPAKSQIFMLVGAAIMMPIIIAYTAYAYWVFRGKVGSDGYHD
ncbi:cytochrome d ubiquinol oxidase subunit II [Pacificimonas sp. WHA3]|uniref:Cytochrome d ubiquinol oxidase subunit II n=1 Tax=Pacificimonas pallii TaxID=2827236 RepID=A0ABS6SG69_9SPHN|nr:cytochrome d ubiquinol oxidase subunit II [Pacificimonas pallii]MBV7257395.1 cytochrome d ubiquinol oxidase subunit II [Pacificimonas pallii]